MYGGNKVETLSFRGGGGVGLVGGRGEGYGAQLMNMGLSEND